MNLQLKQVHFCDIHIFILKNQYKLSEYLEWHQYKNVYNQ